MSVFNNILPEITSSLKTYERKEKNFARTKRLLLSQTCGPICESLNGPHTHNLVKAKRLFSQTHGLTQRKHSKFKTNRFNANVHISRKKKHSGRHTTYGRVVLLGCDAFQCHKLLNSISCWSPKEESKRKHIRSQISHSHRSENGVFLRPPIF